MIRLIAALVCMLAIALLSPIESFAQTTPTITVNVPVSVKKLDPRITAVTTNCTLPSTDPVTGATHTIGIASNRVTPVNGAYAGTLQVVFGAPAFDVSHVKHGQIGTCLIVMHTATETGGGFVYEGQSFPAGSPLNYDATQPFKSAVQFTVP